MSRKPRILIIDDDEPSRYALARCLRLRGYQPVEGASGEECLHLVEQGPLDLILLDIGLPDTTGIEICRKLKADPKTSRIPIIQTSASFTGSDDRIAGLESGADAYLVAPWEPRELLAYVSSLLRARNAEDALLQAERRQRLALDAAQLGTWEHHMDSGIIHLDPRATAHFGMAERSVPMDVLVGRIHSEDLPRFQEALRTAADPSLRGPVQIEYRVVDPDGNFRWLSMSGHVQFDGSNGTSRPMVVVGTTQDITDRKRIEVALRESESRLRLAKQAGQIGIFDFIPATGELIWDERLRAMWGVGPEDPVDYKTFLEGIHSEDRDSVEAAVSRALDPAGEGEYNVEYRIWNKGQPRWISAKGQVTFHEDLPARMVGTVQDITAAKALGQELERLVTERTARLNEMVAELEHFSYSITHDMRAPLRAMCGFADLARDALTGHGHSNVETLLAQISSSARRMDLLITDALNYSRAVREELTVTPVDTGKLLESILQTYPQFASNRSRIRLEGSFPVVLANEAGLIQCFSNLIDNALKFVPENTPPQVQIWAEQIVESPSPLKRALETNLPGEHPKPVLGSNSPVAGASKAEWVRFWVEDNGIGIAPRMLPRVFHMFSRGTANFTGNGIGLALVRKIVQRMGGSVGVLSELGKGTRFWLEFRKAPSASTADPRKLPPLSR